MIVDPVSTIQGEGQNETASATNATTTVKTFTLPPIEGTCDEGSGDTFDHVSLLHMYLLHVHWSTK